MDKRLKYIGFLLVLACSGVYGQSISNYGPVGGLNTADPPHTLPPNDFQDLQDCFTDSPGYLEIRGGLATLYTTTGPIQQQYVFSNTVGNKWRIIKSSVQLGYIDTSDNYQLLLATLPALSRLWKMSYNNECYLGTDQKTDRWRFDPTSDYVLTIATYIPCGKYPIVAGDKAFMINITTPMTNDAQINAGGTDESFVLYSKIGDLKNWGYVNGGTSQWLAITRSDGESLTGGFVYNGNLYVTKKHSIGTLVGIWNDDVTDGERYLPLNTNIGCVSMDSIVQLNGKVYFTSTEGEVEFNGTSYRIISNDIQDDFKDMAGNTGVAALVKVYTTATDWGAGTCTNVDTTTVNGSVVLNAGNNQINQISSSTTSAWTATGTHYQTFQTSFTLLLTTFSIHAALPDTNNTIKFELSDDYSVVLASHTIYKPKVGGTYEWIPVDFSTWSIVLTSGTVYRMTWSLEAGYFYAYYTSDNRYTRGSLDGNPNNDAEFVIYLNHYGTNRYGQWSSAVHQLPNFQQWGIMEANFVPTTPNITGTNIQWYVSVATAAAFCTTSNLIQVTTGYVIPSSSGAYILVLASMTTSDVVVSPRIDGITLNYITDAGNTEITLAAYGDEQNYRLWVSGIKEGSMFNDVVYVWQGKTEKWTRLNLNARSFLKYSNELNIGSSLPGTTSKIWKYSTDYNTDAGAQIHPVAHTPDYIPTDRMTDTKYKELWVYVEPTDLFESTTLYYYINKSNTAYKDVAIPLDGYDNFEDMFIKYRVPSDLEFSRFRAISFKFDYFTKLYGFDFLYAPYIRGEK